MKTINEAAEECAGHINTIPNIKMFKKGVAFAQRWIPVEEELPENNFTEYGIQFGLKLLIKCPNGMIYIGNRVFSNDHDKFVWRYLDGGIVYDAVSWRPIELL